MYRQREFKAARGLIHGDLDDYAARLALYSGSAPEVRRAACALLEREIERRRSGKADMIRSVAFATLGPFVLLAVALWSDWSSLFFSAWLDRADESLTEQAVVDAFADSFSSTLWAFFWALLVLFSPVYVWAIASAGSDKRRGTYAAWLQAYRDEERMAEVPRGRKGFWRRGQA